MKHFACLRCEQDRKKQTIGENKIFKFFADYKLFFFFCRSAYTALGLGIRCLRHTKQQVNSSGSYFG